MELNLLIDNHLSVEIKHHFHIWLFASEELSVGLCGNSLNGLQFKSHQKIPMICFRLMNLDLI